MEIYKIIAAYLIGIVALVGLCRLLYRYWRHTWFFRNPPRTVPPEQAGILSPADGTVVYVKEVLPGDEVITIKRGLKATINDISREDLTSRKVLIGIFMSPFNVHYNRIPLSGKVRFIHHYPAIGSNLCMIWMHLRTVLNCLPHYKNSVHIIQNERTVTAIEGRYRGRSLSSYVVQIAAKNVNGIDSYVDEGDPVQAGQVFGMIRIGSQVDLIINSFEGMKIRVRPGEKVFAGETILIE
jgi:phosphatidylserine decarboxylase